MTYRATSTAFYDAVVDAASGAVLYRQNLVKAAADAEVYPNHPGASATETVDLEDFGLPAGSTVLDGDWSKQWADVDDDDVADAAERTRPSTGSDFVYPFTPFTPGASCPATGALRVESRGPRLVGDEPRPERRPGLLPRLALPRPPRR